MYAIRSYYGAFRQEDEFAVNGCQEGRGNFIELGEQIHVGGKCAPARDLP